MIKITDISRYRKLSRMQPAQRRGAISEKELLAEKALVQLAEKAGIRNVIFQIVEAPDRNAAYVEIYDLEHKTKQNGFFFTSSLVECLSPSEISAVVGHELGHAAIFNSKGFSIIRPARNVARVVSRWLDWKIFQQVNPEYLLSIATNMHFAPVRAAKELIARFAKSYCFTAIGFAWNPASMFLSRREEFAADRFAVKLTGKPEDLISALQKLQEQGEQATALSLMNKIYVSHPHYTQRIARLQTIDLRMD